MKKNISFPVKKSVFVAFCNLLMGKIHFNSLSLQVESLVFSRGSNHITIFDDLTLCRSMWQVGS